MGLTTVQCTAKDRSGNIGTWSFNVTVTYLAKWLQWPDTSPNGFDVRAERPKILAEDFLCTKSGLITNVHLWASWLNDNADPNAIFQLGLWSDMPKSGAPNGELITDGRFELAFTNAGGSTPISS